jgi:hypothetical protein
MSATLSCTLQVTSERPTWYWWPLYFEAMRRIDFATDHPAAAAQHLGDYFRADAAEVADQVGEGVPFRTIWEVASTVPAGLLLQFWSTRGEDFRLKGEVASERGARAVRIALHLGSEHLPNEMAAYAPGGEAERRIRRWLDGARTLYELVGPASGELAWERWGDRYVVGRIGAPFAPRDLAALTIAPVREDQPEPAIQEQILPDGATLHVVKPFPVPFRGDWTLISWRLDAHFAG